MGRDKPKKYEKMDYWQKQEYLSDQGKKYGVSKDDFTTSQGGGGGRYDRFNADGYEKAIAKAANNNYDNREALKYGADSGNKHFEDLNTKGISNLGELADLDRALRKYGKGELGQKNTTSANDFGGISRALFNESRDNFGEQFATKEDLSSMQKIKNITENEEPRELSDRGQAAIEAADYSFEPTNRGLGSPGYAYDPNAAIKNDEAGDFMKQYKADIQKGIGNVPGRGIMSLHNRF